MIIGYRFGSKGWMRVKRSHLKWFFLRLFGKVSIFHGFDIDEGECVKLRKNKKYLQISNNHVKHDGSNMASIEVK